MEKIKTLFAKNIKLNKVIDEYHPEILQPSSDWIATEKLPGANVRVTIRNGKAMRLEVRKMPSVAQKRDGIHTPWYVDASTDELSPHRWLWDAVENTNFFGVPDGEWSGEAVGPHIKGNQLELAEPLVYLFSLIPWRDSVPSNVLIPHVFERVPFIFDDLQEYLKMERSQVNPNVNIEGIVWWYFEEPVAKIKRVDFRGF